MLHSLCQQIWKTQQWPQEWKNSVFIPVPMKDNANECSNYLTAAAAAKLFQSCLTLHDPIDGSPPGYPNPGILQARTLEWVAISFSNAWKWKVKVKSLSHVQLTWTAAYQASPSVVFSRQEYWIGLPLPSPNYLTIAVTSQASNVLPKILQARLQQYMNWELPDIQIGFRKGRGMRDQISNICWIIKNWENFRKMSTSASLTTLKPLTVWITTNWKILKEMGITDHLTSASWETCMQLKKQQLEPDWNSGLVQN